MTQEQKERIDYYVSKTGKLPHFQSLAKDFNLSLDESNSILREFKSSYSPKINLPRPNDVSEVPKRISQETYESIRNKNKDDDTDKEILKHIGGNIFLQIISGIVFIACATRGFSVILDLNNTSIFYGIVSGIIFQGGSAILPVVSFLFFSKKRIESFLIGVFLLIGGLGSMTYETWASISNFHEINVKQELKATESKPSTGDAIVQSLEENIKSVLDSQERSKSLLAKRQAELNALPKSDPGLALAEARVQANLADLDSEASRLSSLQGRKTARLSKLDSKQDSASALNIVSDDQTNKNGFELFIIVVPSLMMVLFTPIFFGIAMFGIGRKEK